MTKKDQRLLRAAKRFIQDQENRDKKEGSKTQGGGGGKDEAMTKKDEQGAMLKMLGLDKMNTGKKITIAPRTTT